MPIFRMDYYMQAIIDREVKLEEDSRKMLEALKSIAVLKNVNMSKVESADKTWIEYEGSIDIPQGSKAFLALLRRKDEKEPYDIFVRIDINKEAETRERAEKEAREWVEKTFAQPIRSIMGAKKIYIGTPLEIIKNKRTHKA